MITRRNCLIAASAALISAPTVVRAINLMPIRGIVMLIDHDPIKSIQSNHGPQIQQNYYGFCDRLAIDLRYKSGALRGRSLLQLIDQGVLNHIPRTQLAFDLAQWGTDELSLNARHERAAFLGYEPFYSAIGQKPMKNNS
jgi:hypothetical protein